MPLETESDKKCFIRYEEHRPGLPEEFDGPDGWRCLRTGPIHGGVSRHPAEDWISDRLPGPERRIPLAAIFVYDPKAGEIKVERVGRIEEYFRKREEYQTGGWKLVESGLDRVVGYRPFTPNSAYWNQILEIVTSQ